MILKSNDLKDQKLELSATARKIQLEIIEQRANIMLAKLDKSHKLDDDIMALVHAIHLLYRTLDHNNKHSRTRLKDALNYASISADSVIRFEPDGNLAQIDGVYSLDALSRYVQW